MIVGIDKAGRNAIQLLVLCWAFGGMVTVYLAEHLVLKQKVAVNFFQMFYLPIQRQERGFFRKQE